MSWLVSSITVSSATAAHKPQSTTSSLISHIQGPIGLEESGFHWHREGLLKLRPRTDDQALFQVTRQLEVFSQGSQAAEHHCVPRPRIPDGSNKHRKRAQGGLQTILLLIRPRHRRDCPHIDMRHIFGLGNDYASLLPYHINRIIVYACNLTLMTKSRATISAKLSDLVCITTDRHSDLADRVNPESSLT